MISPEEIKAIREQVEQEFKAKIKTKEQQEIQNLLEEYNKPTGTLENKIYLKRLLLAKGVEV